MIVFEYNICSCTTYSPQGESRLPLRWKRFRHHTCHCAFCWTILQALFYWLCFPLSHFCMFPGEFLSSHMKWTSIKEYLVERCRCLPAPSWSENSDQIFSFPSSCLGKGSWNTREQQTSLSFPLVPPTPKSFFGAGKELVYKNRKESSNPGAHSRLQV